jgi:hypothetical protein
MTRNCKPIKAPADEPDDHIEILPSSEWRHPNIVDAFVEYNLTAVWEMLPREA